MGGGVYIDAPGNSGIGSELVGLRRSILGRGASSLVGKSEEIQEFDGPLPGEIPVVGACELELRLPNP